MRRTVYFIIQIVWSLILSAVIWYLALINASFDFYGNHDDSIMGVILVIGAVIYFALTIVHIVVGAKKVQEWRWWFIPVSLAVAGAVGFIGAMVAVYVPELLNKMF